MIKIDGQVDYVLLVLFSGDRNERVYCVFAGRLSKFTIINNCFDVKDMFAVSHKVIPRRHLLISFKAATNIRW